MSDFGWESYTLVVSSFEGQDLPTLPNPNYVDKLLRMKIEINGRRLISASYYENLIIQM